MNIDLPKLIREAKTARLPGNIHAELLLLLLAYELEKRLEAKPENVRGLGEAAIRILTCAPMQCAEEQSCTRLAIHVLDSLKATGDWPPPVAAVESAPIQATPPAPTWEPHLPPDWSAS